MRITGLTVRNLGPFADLALEFPEGKDDTLADVYLFVGENGTGKSTLLYLIAAALEGKLNKLLGRVSLPDWSAQVETSAVPIRLQASDPGLDASEVYTVWPGGVHKRPAQWSGWYGHPATYFACAYSGLRGFDKAEVESVTQRDIDPHQAHLDFARSDIQNFAQWWVNKWSSAAGLKMKGDDEGAEYYLATQALISDAINQVTGLNVRFDVDPRSHDLGVILDGKRLSFEVLPEGLKSLLSWIGDLYARMDRLTWENDLPIEQRPFLLLLDEIDVHLHPTWQRKVLPIVQRLFPKAQIFATTHSPFVVGSAADARIYPLVRNPDGTARLMSPAEVGEEVQGNLSSGLLSRKGWSYPAILRQVFGVKETFDLGTTEDLNRFYELRNLVLKGRKPVLELQWAAQGLAEKYSTEVQEIVMGELRQTLIATLGR